MGGLPDRTSNTAVCTGKVVFRKERKTATISPKFPSQRATPCRGRRDGPATTESRSIRQPTALLDLGNSDLWVGVGSTYQPNPAAPLSVRTCVGGSWEVHRPFV